MKNRIRPTSYFFLRNKYIFLLYHETSLRRFCYAMNQVLLFGTASNYCTATDFLTHSFADLFCFFGFITSLKELSRKTACPTFTCQIVKLSHAA